MRRAEMTAQQADAYDAENPVVIYDRCPCGVRARSREDGFCRACGRTNGLFDREIIATFNVEGGVVSL